MPGRLTYNDTTGDWEGLLAAFKEKAELFPDAGNIVTALTQQLETVRLLKARKDTARAEKQRATQELDSALDVGRELAMRLRGLAKAYIGPKSEEMVHFGVAPLRKRTRRPAAKPLEVVGASKKEVKPEGD